VILAGQFLESGSNGLDQELQGNRRCNIWRRFKTTRRRSETGSIFRRTIASPVPLQLLVKSVIISSCILHQHASASEIVCSTNFGMYGGSGSPDYRFQAAMNHKIKMRLFDMTSLFTFV
jgi:hypothetical protein